MITRPACHLVARRRLARAALGMWFAVVVAVGASLLARHSVALPRPDANLARAMATLRGENERGRWMAVHVLYTDCRCSGLIADRLVHTRRPDVAEHVVLVGSDPDLVARLEAKHFAVHAVSAEELDRRFHVQAAPLLVVIAPGDDVRYAGGYTDRKQGPAPKDLEILDEARAGRSRAALPVLGCAVEEKLRNSINPLRLP